MAFVQIFAYAAVLFTFLVAVGSCVTTFVTRGNPHAIAVPSALVGLGLIQIVLWQVSSLLGIGLSIPIRYLVMLTPVCGVVGLICLVKRRGFRFLAQTIPWSSVSSAVGSLLVFMYQWRHVLADGYLTVSGGNGDVAAYGQVAKHLLRHNFNQPGVISGSDLGYIARTDVTGAYHLVAVGRQMLGVPFNQVLIVSLAVAYMMIANATAVLIRRYSSIDVRTIPLLAVLPQTMFITSYLGGTFFLAQLIGTAIFIALVSQTLQACHSRGHDGVASGVLAGILVASVLLSYPHMVTVVIPFCCLLVVNPRSLLVSMKRIVWILAVVATGAISVVQRLPDVVTRILNLATDTVNGWPLPWMLPSQILGFRVYEYDRATRGHWVASVSIFAVIGTLWLWKKTRVGIYFPYVRILVFIGLSYLYFCLSSGDSYRQWKWISFFVPLIVVALVVPTLIKLGSLNHRIIMGVAYTGIVIWATSNLIMTDRYEKQVADQTIRVSEEMTQIGKFPALWGVRTINVATGPYLESMWPTLFLGNRQVHVLFPSYWALSKPSPNPTLVYATTTMHSHVQVTKLNDLYAIVQYPTGDISTSSTGLKASVIMLEHRKNWKVGSTAHFEVRIKNTGTATWLGSGGYPGAVNLGVRLIDDSSTRTVNEFRVDIGTFPNYVLPDVEISTKFEVKFSKAGSYRLVVEPVSEQVNWFGDVNITSRLVVPVSVT